MIVLDKGDSQIVLYAKHHFARGDLLVDIRKLIAARAGIYDHNAISSRDIIIVLTEIAETLRLHSRMTTFSFMSRLVVGSVHGDDYDNHSAIERFIGAMLWLFVAVKVMDGEDELVELAPPDFSILPPSEPNKSSQP